MSRPSPDLFTAHPVDMLELLAKKAGREANPEWLASMRCYCDEIVDTALEEG